MVIANVRRLVVRHLGKAGSAAHGAPQQGFVFLSWHPANMRPEPVIFQRGTLPQSNWPTTQKAAGCQKWGIDKILACYTAPMVFVVKQRTPWQASSFAKWIEVVAALG